MANVVVSEQYARSAQRLLAKNQICGSASQRAAGEDPGSQPSAPAQKFFGARRHRLIHPVAGGAFFGAPEPQTLQLEGSSDESIEVGTSHHDVAAKGRRVEVGQPELVSDGLEHGPVEEGDLPIAVLVRVEVSVALDALSRHALDGLGVDDGMMASGTPVVALEVVSRRGKKSAEFDSVVAGHGMHLVRLDRRAGRRLRVGQR